MKRKVVHEKVSERAVEKPRLEKPKTEPAANKAKEKILKALKKLHPMG